MRKLSDDFIVVIVYRRVACSIYSAIFTNAINAFRRRIQMYSFRSCQYFEAIPRNNFVRPLTDYWLHKHRRTEGGATVLQPPPTLFWDILLRISQKQVIFLNNRPPQSRHPPF